MLTDEGRGLCGLHEDIARRHTPNYDQIGTSNRGRFSLVLSR
jgi:hypothetical protein